MRVITRRQSSHSSQPKQGPQKPSRGLSSKKVNDYLRFSLFLVLIGLAYIYNSYEAERKVKQMEAYHKEVKRLKAEYLLRRATLSAGTRFSEIKDQLDTLGLRPLDEPAFKLVKGLEMPLDRIEYLKQQKESREEMDSLHRTVEYALHLENQTDTDP